MYSVIIPSIGRYEFINELLISLKNQTIKSDDIILILNNNCRHDKEIKLLKKVDDLRLIFNNFNLSEKRNLGARLSKNELIFFSDDDDIWYENKAEFILPHLKKFDVVTHNFDKFGFNIKKNCSKLGDNNKVITKKFLLFGENIFGGGSSIITKKKVLLKKKFNSDLKLSEDFEWWIRVLLANFKIFYVSKSLVKYRTHKNNMTYNSTKIYLSSILVTSKFFLSSFYGSFLFINSLIRNSIKLFLNFPFKIFK